VRGRACPNCLEHSQPEGLAHEGVCWMNHVPTTATCEKAAGAPIIATLAGQNGPSTLAAGYDVDTDALQSEEGLDAEYVYLVIDRAERYVEGAVHTIDRCTEGVRLLPSPSARSEP